MTCAVMFGGRMSDAAVLPSGEDPLTWAIKAPGSEIERFIFGRAIEKCEKPKQMIQATMDEHRAKTLNSQAKAPREPSLDVTHSQQTQTAHRSGIGLPRR